MVNQFIGNADTATLSNNTLKVNNQYYNSWNSECQYNIWSRILKIQTSTVVGGRYHLMEVYMNLNINITSYFFEEGWNG